MNMKLHSNSKRVENEYDSEFEKRNKSFIGDTNGEQTYKN